MRSGERGWGLPHPPEESCLARAARVAKSGRPGGPARVGDPPSVGGARRMPRSARKSVLYSLYFSLRPQGKESE